MSWIELARGQGGAVSSAQLVAAGLPARTVSRMVARGELERRYRGVFTLRGVPVEQRTQQWLAVLSVSGLLGFASAAHLWGYVDEPATIELIIPHCRRVTAPVGVRLYRVFVPASAQTTVHGLPVSAPAWSLLDHLGRMTDERALRLLDRALQRQWITRADLEQRVAEYPGRRGNARLRRLLVATADGAAARSERVLHALLRRAGLAGWRANHRVGVGGRVFVLDVAWPRARLAIEIDGFAYHSDVDRFQGDRHRQNALVAGGWAVLRFTWGDLTARPEYVVATVRSQLSRAG